MSVLWFRHLPFMLRICVFLTKREEYLGILEMQLEISFSILKAYG